MTNTIKLKPAAHIAIAFVVTLFAVMMPFSVYAAENTLEQKKQNTLKVGKISQWYTHNGMKVLFQQASSLPIIDFRLIFDAGAARDGGFKSEQGVVLAVLAK